MPSKGQPSNTPTEVITDPRAAQLLWAEWEYRHGVFWNSLYRWGIATVAVTIAPYLLPDLIGKLQLAVLVFPFIAFLLALFSAWHISAEYVRLTPVARRYKKLLGGYCPDDLPDTTAIQKFLKLPVGWIVTIAFLLMAFVVESLNVVVLLWLLFRSSVIC